MLLSVLHFVFKWGIILSIAIFLIQYWLVKKSYTFSEREVAHIAEKYVGREAGEAFDLIHKEFLEKYSGHILQEENTQWIFMNCGGWMGSMKILHASITEYLLFFGTAVDTSGNSGRYWANISDTILTGKFRQWKEGEINSTLFKPGDTVYHYIGEAAAVQWSAGTWMVEYGRGFIPSTLGFALADTFFSTQDFVNLFYILRVYSRSLCNEFSNWLFWQLSTAELPSD